MEQSDRLHSLSSAFLAGEMKDLHLTPEDMELDAQQSLLANTVFHHHARKYELNPFFVKQFLKNLFLEIESSGCEVHLEVYRYYSRLSSSVAADDSYSNKYFHKVYLLHPNDKCALGLDESFIALREATCSISNGTTGLKVWPAAFYLAQWMCENGSTFHSSRFMELGSGLGFAGIAILKLFPTIGGFLFTDSHGKVLDTLQWNVSENIASKIYPSSTTTSPTVEVIDLDWREFDEEKCLTLLSKFPIDYVVGSDIGYDVDLLEHLSRTLRLLLNSSSTRTGFIVQIVRNSDTLNRFKQALSDLQIQVSEELLHPPAESNRMFYFPSSALSPNSPVVLLKLSCL